MDSCFTLEFDERQNLNDARSATEVCSAKFRADDIHNATLMLAAIETGNSKPKYKRKAGVEFGPVDVVKYDEAFGANGYMINSPQKIGPTLRKAFEVSGPVLIGIPVDYRDNHKLFERVHEHLLV